MGSFFMILTSFFTSGGICQNTAVKNTWGILVTLWFNAVMVNPGTENDHWLFVIFAVW